MYLEDSYRRECSAGVTTVKDGKYVILDRTIFYPKGGGQPHDEGQIVRGNEVFKVVYVGTFEGEISHEADKPGLAIGDEVKCELDWPRRYRLMRSHTAAHTLASILCQETGTLITGNQLEVDKIRFDFNLDKFDQQIFQSYVQKANSLFKQDIPVRWYELARDEALKIPGIVKMAAAFPPNLKMLRIVEIEGVDAQADGGTHVRNLKEVGEIEFLKAENKGKNNRRVYFRLRD
jgi:misacylated tRNA(Ala) deacylase